MADGYSEDEVRTVRLTTVDPDAFEAHMTTARVTRRPEAALIVKVMPTYWEVDRQRTPLQFRIYEQDDEGNARDGHLVWVAGGGESFDAIMQDLSNIGLVPEGVR